MTPRQAGGVLLVILALLAGRIIRHQVLVDPQGQWNQHLWLDEMLDSSEPEVTSTRTEKPRITSPLPINTCSEDSLTLLPGVGPVLAERIAKSRLQGMVFRIPEDLKMVKGIGPSLAGKISPLVVFGLPDSEPDAGSRSGREKSPTISQ